MSKYVIFLMSDPKGGDEATGRLFNGLALAADAKAAGDEVELVFAAAGTRWPAELEKVGHPAGELYQSLREHVAGASCGCAEVFGASQEVESCGLPLLADQTLAGTSGLAGIRRHAEAGSRVFIF
ncbi:MAG: hypothetical protein H6807_15465 [Planctomycetes bacterium]|nr:hypothetical protein [Planctomycetota bacterium]